MIRCAFKYQALHIALLVLFLFLPCWSQQEQPLENRQEQPLESTQEQPLEVVGTPILDLPPRKTFGPAGVRPLDLDDVVQLGLRQNPKMRVAEEQVEQARAQYEEQRAAKGVKVQVQNLTTVQPRRSIDTDNLLTERVPNFPDRFILVDPVTDQFGLTIQKLLTTFGKVESMISAAFLQIDVQSANAELVEQNLRYDIKKAFFDKLKADAFVDAQRSNLAVSRQNLYTTQELLDQGVASRYDLLQAQITVTEAVEDPSENLTQVDLAAAKLSNVVNETEERIQPLPPPPVIFNPDLELDDLRAVAANNRAEMTALNYRMDVAQELLQAAKKSNRPELVLSANYRTAFGQSLSPTNVPSINLQIQWTLFDGGLKKAQIQEAESVLQELDASRVSAVNDINLEVEQAWLELLQNRFNLVTAKEQLSNAEEYYEMAMERFIHGLSTALEVSESLRNLIAARSQLVRAEFDRDLAFARLERTLGVDVPDRNLTEEFINTARRRPDSETDSER